MMLDEEFKLLGHLLLDESRWLMPPMSYRFAWKST
jgi:hypothetical protein